MRLIELDLLTLELFVQFMLLLCDLFVLFLQLCIFFCQYLYASSLFFLLFELNFLIGQCFLLLFLQFNIFILQSYYLFGYFSFVQRNFFLFFLCLSVKFFLNCASLFVFDVGFCRFPDGLVIHSPFRCGQGPLRYSLRRPVSLSLQTWQFRAKQLWRINFVFQRSQNFHLYRRIIIKGLKEKWFL